jgi:hypothetical protein
MQSRPDQALQPPPKQHLVTCREMNDLMNSSSKDSAQTEGSAEHLAKCERCRILTQLLDQVGRGPVPSESQLKRIKIAIVEHLKPVRPLPPSRVLLLAVASVFLCVMTVGALRLGTNGWATLNIDQRIAVFSSLAVSAILLADSMVRQMVPGSRHTFPPAMLSVGILLVLTLVIATTFRPHEEVAFVAGGLGCIRNGLIYSAPASLLFWMLLRLGAVLFPKLIGFAVGGLAGLIGLSVLEVNCPNLNIFHILVWHWGVLLMSSLAGALVGAAVEYIEQSRQPRDLPSR